MKKGDKGKQAVGYIRVSTDKQEVENQRAAINAAAASEGLKVVFTEEQISSRKEDRQIYKVIENLKITCQILLGFLLVVYCIQVVCVIFFSFPSYYPLNERTYKTKTEFLTHFIPFYFIKYNYDKLPD